MRSDHYIHPELGFWLRLRVWMNPSRMPRALCGTQQEPRLCTAYAVRSRDDARRSSGSEISTDDKSMAGDHFTDHIVVVIHSVQCTEPNSPPAIRMNNRVGLVYNCDCMLASACLASGPFSHVEVG
jgi:hypothetical protein